jgi:hypothetical protein
MTHTGVDKDLTPDEAFDITLLVNAEMTYQVLTKRNANTEGHIGKRRRNLLKSLGNIVESINQTYKGQVPESFIKRAETYYLTTEAAMNTLLKGYKANTK